MGDEVKQVPRLDCHDLYVFLSRWIATNRAHTRLEIRWLSCVAEQVEKLALGLKSGGAEALSEHDQQRIRDFRAGEIEAEKAKPERQSNKLDAELARLRSPIKSAA